MSKPLNWGILGTGNIAGQFADGLAGAQRGRAAAVGSRHAESARSFARDHHVPAAHGSYQDLIDDPQVEAVYVALPNALHHLWTLQALRAGKHVLCEKPLACNAAQGREMFDLAQRLGLVLVEAFMYRSHPLLDRVLAQVRGGAIGQLQVIRTSFCFRSRRVEGNVRFNPDLAGGSLMDVGCYCVDFSRLLAGSDPLAMHAVGHLHESGVDEFAAGTLQFSGGLVAAFTCALTVQADNTASLCGSEGYLEIPVPWKPPQQAAPYTIGHSTPPRMDRAAVPVPPRQTFTVEADRPLYALEADDFAAVVRDRRPPRISAAESLSNLVVLDTLRQQLGLAF